MTTEFVYITLSSMHCYWQRDQAAMCPS